MGSYLSVPITEKISQEEFSEKLQCGYSSMQGWRISQEDAHNSLLEFDDDTAFFAVYDGHGGHEVALYCSLKFPAFLKELDSYKSGDVETALQEAFLGFDKTISTPEIITMLKEMAKESAPTEDSDEDDENVQNLYKEARMPIEEVMEKYTSNLKHPMRLVADENKLPISPFLKAKGQGDGSWAKAGASSSGVVDSSPESKEEKIDGSGDAKPVLENQENGHASPETNQPQEDAARNNGDVGEEKSVDISPQESLQNSNGSTPKRGKALTKTKGVEGVTEKGSNRPKRSVKEIYANLLNLANADSEESEDEDDKTFEGPDISSSDDDDAEDSNVAEEESSYDDDDLEEAEEEEDDAVSDEDENATVEFAKNMVEEPGSDSGCTAVVALLKGDTLYVANAGDSRCIVCRSGQAVEMSFDHKPEDQVERERIVKAGGRVTADGRVNGGLNLSRAIGDHAYKQNKQMTDREQMITALPDIKTLKIDLKTDEFMVLACDGIWNFMSSQEVVDFVRPGIDAGEKLSKICEELFDHCLAPNTSGDGTGCDNMTAIIVKFNGGGNLKRPASELDDADDNTKRCKTEDESVTSST